MLITHPFAHILRLLAQTLRIGDVVVCDGGEQFLLVLAIERRLAHQHFVQQNTVRPPINRLSIRLIQDNLLRKADEK